MDLKVSVKLVTNNNLLYPKNALEKIGQLSFSGYPFVRSILKKRKFKNVI